MSPGAGACASRAPQAPVGAGAGGRAASAVRWRAGRGRVAGDPGVGESSVSPGAGCGCPGRGRGRVPPVLLRPRERGGRVACRVGVWSGVPSPVAGTVAGAGHRPGRRSLRASGVAGPSAVRVGRRACPRRRSSRPSAGARVAENGGMAGSGERARHWRYAELPGVDLLHAQYIRKTFVRHTHEHFVIAAIAEGAEVFHHGGSRPVRRGRLAGPGQPGHPAHRAGRGAGGMAVRGRLPGARTGGGDRGRDDDAARDAGVRAAVLDDPYTVELVHRVLRAADDGNALAADTLLRVAVTRLLRLNGGPLPRRQIRTAGATTAARARAVLEERMADPPSLERLAGELGEQPVRVAAGLPGRLRHAAPHLADGRPGASGAAAAGHRDLPGRGRRRRRIHRPAAPEPALRADRRRAARCLPARAQERTRRAGAPLLPFQA
ncbi:hypothetical protein SVIOM342S_07977 [Streptomyces violaceorubidus]